MSRCLKTLRRLLRRLHAFACLRDLHGCLSWFLSQGRVLGCLWAYQVDGLAALMKVWRLSW